MGLILDSGIFVRLEKDSGAIDLGKYHARCVALAMHLVGWAERTSIMMLF